MSQRSIRSSTRSRGRAESRAEDGSAPRSGDMFTPADADDGDAVSGRDQPNEEFDELAELFGDEDQVQEDEEEGENLFGDNMERDYRPQPELDVYSESGLDDASELTELSLSARRAAEREMDQRDNLMDEDALFYEQDDEAAGRRRRRPRRGRAGEEEPTLEGLEEEEEIPVDILENMRGRTIREHVSEEAVGKEIERRFKSFLRAYKDPASRKVKYIEAIKQMVADNRESLEVDYDDLAHETGEQNICYFLPEAPNEVCILVILVKIQMA
ncbi:unnamed protein product [Anisakis simplex]|uniref:DNA replication licensing factor MCM2 (inferred by orthology to a human protein) n=1 Tax=Anisakis simplex TaxID=6269 RepID=A0A0M3KB53_ANISI|nr:unnamed protein product [Anisakis simplex]